MIGAMASLRCCLEQLNARSFVLDRADRMLMISSLVTSDLSQIGAVHEGRVNDETNDVVKSTKLDRCLALVEVGDGDTKLELLCMVDVEIG